MVEVGLDGLCDELEHVPLLLAAGFEDCQQRFHEAAAGGALRAKQQLALHLRPVEGGRKETQPFPNREGDENRL